MAASMEHMGKKEEKVIFPVKSGASLVKIPPVFSEDSRYLFCCSGPAVKVYSTVSGECVRELRGHSDSVTGLAINPNNKLQLVSCSLDSMIIVWDYTDGILLRKIPMSAPMFGLYTSTGRKKAVYVLKQASKSDCVLVKQSLAPNKKSNATVILTGCKNRKMTAVGPEGSYFVKITGKSLYVKTDAKSSQTFFYKTDYEQMTCVACHPRDLCIATGCKDGKILLWYKFLNNSDLRTVIHWHSLPVKHLAFTPEGSYLLSGGHECVLVKWHSGTQYNDFLPRLGAPINHVICSTDNSLYATTHDDNVIHIISSNFKVEHIFQGLTRGHLKSQQSEAIPTGLLCDPRSRSLVLNGKPGHIQFYSVQEDKHLYNLDIVQQNYISPENLEKPLAVTEVTGVAFDDSGTWMATAEYWNDDIMSPEIRLKFWQFDDEKQSYVLNTTVELPHEQRVASLEFRPCSQASSPGMEHMLVTTSADGKFKTWVLEDDTDIYRKNTKWNCESVGFYQDLAASQVSFSEDGSLLAVVFGSRITLWEPEICLLKKTLIQNMSKEEIRCLKFGHCQCSQYVVSCTSSQLSVWDLISCTVSWTVDLSITSLVADLASEVMAVFTDNKDLFVFKPSSPNPAFSHVAVSNSNILSGVFIPQSKKNIYGQTTLEWQNGSQLYFMNREQELRTVMFEADTLSTSEPQDLVTVEQNLPQTALSLIVSREGRSSKEVKVTQKAVTRQPSGSYLKEMLVSAAHTLPSVTSLCQPFINSLLIGSKQNSKRLSEDDDDMNESETSQSPRRQTQTGPPDSGVDSDMETDWSQGHTQSSVLQSSVNTERTDLSESQSDPNVTEGNQSKSRQSEGLVKDFSDTEIADILATDTDWYMKLKQS